MYNTNNVTEEYDQFHEMLNVLLGNLPGLAASGDANML
jgi:hypothetical protein